MMKMSRFAPRSTVVTAAMPAMMAVLATLPLVGHAQTVLTQTSDARVARPATPQKANPRGNAQVYGTAGVVDPRGSTRTVQNWSTNQGGLLHFGPDGQSGGSSGPVYVPVPVPVPYPNAGPAPYPGQPGQYPGYQPAPVRPNPYGPGYGHSPSLAPPSRYEPHPYGPNVVPGWGAAPAHDYRPPPQGRPGYYGSPR